MSKIDWSKPIEVYNPFSPSTSAEPAEVVATDLRGGNFKVGVRWSTESSDHLVRVSVDGVIDGSLWQVRNAPTQVTKYILLSKRLNPGENSKDSRVVVMYDTYEEAVANCASTHKVVEVTYEL